VGALLVTLAVIASSAHVLCHRRRRRRLARPAVLIPGLVAVQVTLGALTVLTKRDVWINSVHLVCGALVLATSIVITLRSWRVQFAAEPAYSSVDADRRAGSDRVGRLSRPGTPSGARA